MNTNLDLARQGLFADRSNLTPGQQEMVQRYEAAFAIWLNNPVYSDREMTIYLMSTFGISYRQAHRDIGEIKYLLGNVTNARKEWQRYKVISMLDEAYRMAKDQENPKEMISAADKLGKYTQLDQADAKEIPWDEIIPQNFEPTDDPTVIGLKPVKNLDERIKRLKQKFGAMIEIEDGATIDDQEDLL